jgi:NADP-dependent 3-hydroxy acid dehydrogenase YdfG
MSEHLGGTVALITGASSGIGMATALQLANRGGTVALVARRKDRLDELAERISQSGGSALAVEADITDPEQAGAAVTRAVDAFGRLDTVVNNAGIMLIGPVEDAPVEEWDRMVAINVQGLLYLTHAALPHLLQAAQGPRGTADIVNVSSTAGRVALANMAVYNLTKFGVGAFSEALRQEVSTRNVRVTLVEPGPVATELFTHIRPEVMLAAGEYTLLEADDVAEAIAFAVSRPSRTVVNEILLRPRTSAGAL